MRRTVALDVAVPEADLAAAMAAHGVRRADAVRTHVARTYSKVLRTNPHIDPDLLLVDITDAGDGVRVVVHDGAFVPSVRTQFFTRRYHVAPWLALGASFS